MDDDNPLRRRYDNAGRQRQAIARRDAILSAGHRLLVTDGYAGTTMTAVAKTAGVSVETVYKSFGTKSELVRQILGAVIVGDDEPVAAIDRPAMQAALRAGSGKEIIAAFADASTTIAARVGPLAVSLFSTARVGEPELRDIVRIANEQRLKDFRCIADAIAETGDLDPSLDAGRAADILWAVGSPEVHQQLTVDRAWSDDEYRTWLTTTLQASLLGQPPAT